MDTPDHPVPEATRRADRNRRMVRDWENGATVTQIARRYDLSLSWTGVLLRRNGADLPKAGRGIKRELDSDEVIADYLDGATVRALAETHAVSYGKIYRLLQQHHVPMRPRGGTQ